MYPPEWLVKQVEREYPYFRLGWAGRKARGDELNPGRFVLLQLYPRYVADREIFAQRWMKDDGVIYGSPIPHNRVPFIAAGLSQHAVYKGDAVLQVRRLAKGTQWKELKRQEAREVRETINELAGEAGEHLKFNARENPFRGPTIAKKFVPQEEKDRAAGQVPELIDDDYFLRR